jgi:hypothetical protein
MPTKYLLDIYFLFLQLTILTVTSLSLTALFLPFLPRLRSIGFALRGSCTFQAAAVFLSPLDFGDIRRTSDIYARCSLEEHPFGVWPAG